MWTINKTLITEQFRALVLLQIPSIRETFEKEMHALADADFGWRFRDDEQVLSAVVSIVTKGLNSKAEVRAVLPNYFDQPQLLKQAIWDGLKVAAETDYYYNREKKY